ncbi:MAG: SPOR domain-containing protein [Melioribacteraceae bacterium]|nr:SPOR domain-containing protein [Melioribacteraceae bacterium]MCF8265375.1 SPOR domain-containing protein [Melioribacteraceae bacterium]
MNSRNFLLTLLFLIIFNSISIGQLSNLKWVLILDLDNEIVFIDTAQIKKIGTQVSVWSLTRFREPRMVNDVQSQVSEFKTQFLFPERTQTYTTIGTIYYDIEGKIVEQPIRPNLPGRPNSGKKIPANSKIKIIKEKSLQFLETGAIVIGESEFLAAEQDGFLDDKRVADSREPADDSGDMSKNEEVIADDPIAKNQNEIKNDLPVKMDSDSNPISDEDNTSDEYSEIPNLNIPVPPIDLPVQADTPAEETEEEDSIAESDSGEEMVPDEVSDSDFLNLKSELEEPPIAQSEEAVLETPTDNDQNNSGIEDQITDGEIEENDNSQTENVLAELRNESTDENNDSQNIVEETPEVIEEKPIEIKSDQKPDGVDITKETQEKDSQTEEQQFREIYDPVTDTYKKVPLPGAPISRASKSANQNSKPISLNTSGDYNNSSERMVRNNIYTDGNLYCIQLGSGKNKSAAEQEVSTLISRGHNAFLTEAFIKSKNATYYRIRVGYFDSFQEANNYRSRL